MIVGMAFDHQAHEQTIDIDKHLVRLGQGKRVNENVYRTLRSWIFTTQTTVTSTAFKISSSKP